MCSPFNYALLRFPPTKWDEMDDYNGLSEQVHVIAEESGECATALRKEGPERLAYECWDVIQAAEGVLRRLGGNGVDIKAQRDAVEKRCRERGYYDLQSEQIALDAGGTTCRAGARMPEFFRTGYVRVTLFKPSGKFYTSEDWRIPEEAIGPFDMGKSPDFRRIDGGAVLVPSHSPWGFPHLFPSTTEAAE